MALSDEAKDWYIKHGYQFNAYGTPHKPLPPDTVVGYESFERDEDGEVSFRIFRCAYHEKAEDWQGEGDRAVTVRDTWQKQYDCDMMGCELNYFKQPMMSE